MRPLCTPQRCNKRATIWCCSMFGKHVQRELDIRMAATLLSWCMMQVLARIVPLRDFFLEPSNYSSSRSQLVQRFGELMRKIWNPRNFKGQVSRPRADRSMTPPTPCCFAACQPYTADVQMCILLTVVSVLLRRSARTSSCRRSCQPAPSSSPSRSRATRWSSSPGCSTRCTWA